jgi:hypothetical protein
MKMVVGLAELVHPRMRMGITVPDKQPLAAVLTEIVPPVPRVTDGVSMPTVM